MRISFSNSLLNKERVLLRLFLAYLFQNHDRAMAFLQESRLSHSSTLRPKCANPMKMCRAQQGVNECIWRCYRIQLVHGNMRCSKLSLGEVMLPIYDIVKTVPSKAIDKEFNQMNRLKASGFNFEGMWFWRTWKAIKRNQVKRKGGWIWWKQNQEKKIQQTTRSKGQRFLEV